MSDLAVCSRCGGMCGEPGSNFGDYGWHPCYHCGATGECGCPECRDSDYRPDDLPNAVDLAPQTIEDSGHSESEIPF